jgi:hypothetical protein
MELMTSDVAELNPKMKATLTTVFTEPTLFYQQDKLLKQWNTHIFEKCVISLNSDLELVYHTNASAKSWGILK